MKRAILGLLLLAACGLASAAEPATRTIVLVRHGHYDSDPSADPKLGPHLSALGVAQGQLVGARLAALPTRFDALYVSPMHRARDTAAAIATSVGGQGFRVIDDLAECTPPNRDPKSMAEERAEDLASCRAQLDRAFTAHFRPAEGAPRTELFVAHGNVIRYLVARALGMDETNWLSMSVGHVSITRIRVEADGSLRVVAVGDVGHLPPSMLTGARGDAERSLQVSPMPQAR